MKLGNRTLGCSISRKLVRRGFCAVAALVLTAIGSHTRPAAAEMTESSPAAADSVAYLRTEVRLRKLHLVRPDLIPYPIQYDIIC